MTITLYETALEMVLSSTKFKILSSRLEDSLQAIDKCRLYDAKNKYIFQNIFDITSKNICDTASQRYDKRR